MVYRILKSLAGLALYVVAGIGVLLGLLWLDHNRGTVLPEPTGPYAVGRSLQYWSDTTPDARAPVRTAVRDLAVWIWYPADASARTARPAAYLPTEWQAALHRFTSPLLTQFVLRDPARVRTHSASDVAFAPSPTGFPVLLLRGGHTALVASYTTLAEELASHGYVVVGIDAPYRSFVVPLGDGRVIPRAEQNDVEIRQGADAVQLADILVEAWSQDLQFVVSRLQQLNAAASGSALSGRLDLTRIGAFGHSLGGASALQFCHDDARCRAVADIDGAPFGSVVREGLHQPLLLLLGDHNGEADRQSQWIDANFASLLAHIDARNLSRATLTGASHLGFADPTRSPVLIGILQRAGNRMPSRQQLSVTAHNLLEFFDSRLGAVP